MCPSSLIKTHYPRLKTRSGLFGHGEREREGEKEKRGAEARRRLAGARRPQSDAGELESSVFWPDLRSYGCGFGFFSLFDAWECIIMDGFIFSNLLVEHGVCSWWLELGFHGFGHGLSSSPTLLHF